MSGPAASLVRRVMSAAGLTVTYGLPLADVPVHDVEDPAVATALAHAHRAVHGSVAAVHTGEGTLVVPGQSPEGGPFPSLPSERLKVTTRTDLAALAPVMARAALGSGLQIDLDLDLSAPAAHVAVALPPLPASWLDGEDDGLLDLAVGAHVVVLAGPGVVREGAVGALRALAAAGRLGVLNTWGAKGVFHWQSRHHWATVGLQERDLELAGIGSADLLVVTGVDEREAPRRQWSDVPHRIVAPGALGPLAERWPGGGTFPEVPPLRQRLAAVTQAGWAARTLPLQPTQVTQHYAQVLGGGGLVAADAGVAGYWVARTFATTRLGSAFVPAAPLAGWAAACAVTARIVTPLRPALAVVDGPVDAPTEAVLAAGARLGVRVGVEEWVPDGDAITADDHRARLEQLSSLGGTATLRTDPSQLDKMIAVAGPVRAWTERATGQKA